VTRELLEIAAKFEQLDPKNSAVLATVVDVRGSSYRLPGAKMLILENGETFGMVSGGCLEADVLERAKKVIRTGNTEVFTYDTTGDENSVFSLNMGCRGVVRILLEPLEKDGVLITSLKTILKVREKRVIATLIKSPDGKIGGRITMAPDEGFLLKGNFPSFMKPENVGALLKDCVSLLTSPNSFHLRNYEIPRGELEFFFETILPPVALLIFGAGADAIPLADAANLLGWKVSVLDHRPAYLEESRFPVHDRILIRSDGPNPKMVIDDLTAAVIMSHNYDRDRENLSRALHSDTFYVAALGPKRRTEQILQELNSRGETFSDKQLEKLMRPPV
jgi:Xanthine and CO dehydrogenases maturation factor, XdhC/CoxF family